MGLILKGRKAPRRPARPGGTVHAPPRALTPEDVDGFMRAAEQRTSATVPSVFDLEASLQELERLFPVDVAVTRRQIKWLLKACEKHIGTSWEHPYR